MNFQLPHHIIHSIPYKSITSFFNLHSPLHARARICDAARQTVNANTRSRMAKSGNLNKAKARPEMSDAAIHEYKAKTRKHKAKVRSEMSAATIQEEKTK